MIGIVITYSILKLQETITNTDTRHDERTVTKYYHDTDVFNGDKKPGFQLAFGIMTFDGNFEMTEEPWFASLKLYHK